MLVRIIRTKDYWNIG